MVSLFSKRDWTALIAKGNSAALMIWLGGFEETRIFLLKLLLGLTGHFDGHPVANVVESCWCIEKSNHEKSVI